MLGKIADGKKCRGKIVSENNNAWETEQLLWRRTMMGKNY
jgi:hypothetical protein